MNDQWRKENRGDFGWSVDGATEIKAFWLPAAEFVDPEAKVSGKIADSTAKVLEQKLAEHAGEVTPQPNLISALRSGSLTAFGVAEDLGGGYVIVLTAGLMDFLVIASENGGITPSKTQQSIHGATSDFQSGSLTKVEKVECQRCQALILPSTAAKTQGFCMPCFQGKNSGRRPTDTGPKRAAESAKQPTQSTPKTATSILSVFGNPMFWILVGLAAWLVPLLLAWFVPNWAFQNRNIVIPCFLGPIVGLIATSVYLELDVEGLAAFVGLVLGLVSVGVGVVGLTEEQSIDRDIVIADIQTSLQPLVSRIRNASVECEPGKAKRPTLWLTSELNSEDYPDLSTIEFPVGTVSWWGRLTPQLGRESTDYHNFPEFEIRSVAIFARKYRPSGRQIELDIGSVPEFRDNARVFVFDSATLKCIWASDLAIGKAASSPGKMLGGGVRRFSILRGDPITPSIPEAVYE